MSYNKMKGKTLNLNEAHRSDGSELIPAEVPGNIDHDDAQSMDAAVATGYTTDDEGLINNYAIETDIYGAKYPSPKQQQHYILLGVGATLFVAMLIVISFAVSIA